MLRTGGTFLLRLDQCTLPSGSSFHGPGCGQRRLNVSSRGIFLTFQQCSQLWQTSHNGLTPALSPTFQPCTFGPTLTTTPAPYSSISSPPQICECDWQTSCPAHFVPNCDIGGTAQSFIMKLVVSTTLQYTRNCLPNSLHIRHTQASTIEPEQKLSII